MKDYNPNIIELTTSIAMVKHSNIADCLNEYSGVATVHGVFYAFSKDVPLLARLVWFCLVIGGLFYAFFMSFQSFENWQNNPIITTLEDTNYPISEVEYPAITICSQGLNLKAVENVLAREYELWKKQNRNKREKRASNQDGLTESLKDEFLKEKYQVTRNQSLLNILQSFTSEDIQKTVKMSSVIENFSSCDEAESDDDWQITPKVKCTAPTYMLDNNKFHSNITQILCKKLCAYRKECVGYVYNENEVECWLRKDMNVSACKMGGENHHGWTVYKKGDNFDETQYYPHSEGTFLICLVEKKLFHFI